LLQDSIDNALLCVLFIQQQF